jgi:hypothetical protein
MVPYGSNMPVRSPVVRVRRPRASFKPNVLHDLLLQAEFNLAESKPKRLMFRHN